MIAELGGKNPLIVDGDADPDQVVPAVVDSAFGFAGQKCSALSRLIVLDHAYDAVVPRVDPGGRRAARSATRPAWARRSGR